MDFNNVIAEAFSSVLARMPAERWPASTWAFMDVIIRRNESGVLHAASPRNKLQMLS